MKFTDLVVRNFLSIGEANLKLDGLGLVMVAGVNLDETSADSNGSGKSSLADAISWCLWGSTARGVSSDEVVNATVGKDTMVSLTVDDDGETYRVDRYRKAGKFKNGLFLYRQADDGSWDDLTKGTASLTQKQVERLVGCSEEVFNAAVYSGQEQMPDIPRMTDKQLKTLVEQAAGVDVLTGAYAVARDRMRAVSQNSAQAQIAFDQAVQRHADSIAHKQRLSDQSTQWANGQAAKIAQLKQRTIDAKTEYELNKSTFDPAAEAELLANIADCEAKIAAVNVELQREKVLSEDIAKAKAAIQTIKQRAVRDEAGVEIRRRAVVDAEAQLEAIKNGVGQPCKSCARPLEAEHLAKAISNAEMVVARCKADQTEVEGSLAATEAKFPAFDKILAGAEDALANHRKGMTDISGESLKLQNLRREQQILERSKVEVERMRTQAVNAAKIWQAEVAAVDPFASMTELATQDMVARASEKTKRHADAKALQEEEAYAQAAVEVFSPTGVRAHRLDEATPYLNERTAHYLGSLADGAIEAYWTTLTENSAGDLREKFSVVVEKQGSAPSFNALSGGEKRKVRLACALALQDLVATRAAKSISLWVGDEVDDALDDAGLERLMGVLEEKARERGTVLIISHNDVRDYARRLITVTKENGLATVDVQ